jgi:PAS domain S-box-containing protein
LKTARHSRKSEGRGPKSEDRKQTPALCPPSAGLRPAPSRELAELRSRLSEAEETLRAIRTGEVDAVVTAGKDGLQVFTLEGAEHAYRVLIESMNEGALTLTTDKTILYANHGFARMVKCPLEQVIGSSFHRFLSVADRAVLRPLVKRTAQPGSKFQMCLRAGDGSQMPVHISLRPLPKNGSKRATIAMVVTDMTEARRTEELLRALTQRVVQVQEAERGRVALELHDHITQLLCAVLVRSQVLADKLQANDGPSKREAVKLREMLGQTADAVERISRNLRPSVLDELGLVAVLRDTSTDFAHRTGVALKLTCGPLLTRLPADIELTLYRILQEALNNVEKHAHAGHVTVNLKKQGDSVQLTIKDDGVGFDMKHHPARRKKTGVLGLFGMHERAAYVDGLLKLKSRPCAGTEIEVRIPLPPGAGAPNRTEL